MPRIAERVERTITIQRLEGIQRFQVGEVQAFNLRDAIHRWYDTQTRFTDPHFQANLVTVIAPDGVEEVYVAIY